MVAQGFAVPPILRRWGELGTEVGWAIFPLHRIPFLHDQKPTPRDDPKIYISYASIRQLGARFGS